MIILRLESAWQNTAPPSGGYTTCGIQLYKVILFSHVEFRRKHEESEAGLA